MTEEKQVPKGTYDDIINELEESLDSFQLPEYREIAETFLQDLKKLEEARK